MQLYPHMHPAHSILEEQRKQTSLSQANRIGRGHQGSAGPRVDSSEFRLLQKECHRLGEGKQQTLTSHSSGLEGPSAVCPAPFGSGVVENPIIDVTFSLCPHREEREGWFSSSSNEALIPSLGAPLTTYMPSHPSRGPTSYHHWKLVLVSAYKFGGQTYGAHPTPTRTHSHPLGEKLKARA